MNYHATKLTTTTKDGQVIISVEKIFGMLCDSNADRQHDIAMQDAVERLSNARSTINLN